MKVTPHAHYPGGGAPEDCGRKQLWNHGAWGDSLSLISSSVTWRNCGHALPGSFLRKQLGDTSQPPQRGTKPLGRGARGKGWRLLSFRGPASQYWPLTGPLAALPVDSERCPLKDQGGAPPPFQLGKHVCSPCAPLNRTEGGETASVSLGCAFTGRICFFFFLSTF